MHKLQDKKAFISDMDGVIYHGNNLLPGAIEFINWLKENDKKYLFLTNSSERSPRELSQKLARLGVDVDETHFYTSALSTASFLAQQKPGGSVFVIGEAGLIQALYQAGLTMNNVDPDYVVIGETRTYSYEKIEDAVGLVQRGAMLIGTNPDLTGPTERGIVPATGDGTRHRSRHGSARETDRTGDGQDRLFSRQAESADDAPCRETAWHDAGRDGHHRRPHGYGYSGGNRIRIRDRSRS